MQQWFLYSSSNETVHLCQTWLQNWENCLENKPAVFTIEVKNIPKTENGMKRAEWMGRPCSLFLIVDIYCIMNSFLEVTQWIKNADCMRAYRIGWHYYWHKWTKIVQLLKWFGMVWMKRVWLPVDIDIFLLYSISRKGVCALYDSLLHSGKVTELYSKPFIST